MSRIKIKKEMKKQHIKIELSELRENPKNPKMHDDKLIKDSIQELGFVDDIDN